jgi:hypothetical protein
MAQADSLNTTAPQAHYVLRYTSMQLDTLPNGAAKVVGDRAIRSFSTGTCYARTSTHPNGAYWVTVLFY